MQTHGCYERPALPYVCSETDCKVTRETDPSGQFKAGRCNRHYLRHVRSAKDKAMGVHLESKTCPECHGTMLHAPRRNSKYCSVSCTAASAERAKSEAAAKRAATGAPRICPVGKTDCGPQVRLYGGVCSKHYYRMSKKGSYELADPVCEELGCTVSRSTDPSRAFKTTRCNMHYLRKRRAEERIAALGARRCPECGADMSTARKNSKYCGPRCTQASSTARNIGAIRMRIRIAGALRKARRLKNPGSVSFSVDDWLALVEKLESRCTYCGKTIEPSDMHMDHIVPLRRGGPHALFNMTLACAKCNVSKRDRPLFFEWAPALLGGKPRWDKTAPRGKRGHPWVSGAWRDENGPLASILALAKSHPELLRAIRLTETFFNQKREAA